MIPTILLLNSHSVEAAPAARSERQRARTRTGATAERSEALIH